MTMILIFILSVVLMLPAEDPQSMYEVWFNKNEGAIQAVLTILGVLWVLAQIVVIRLGQRIKKSQKDIEVNNKESLQLQKDYLEEAKAMNDNVNTVLTRMDEKLSGFNKLEKKVTGIDSRVTHIENELGIK